MTQQQWQRVRELFERALDETPPDVGGWLAREAADDPAVRAEVASLLNHHTRAGSFLVEPVAEQAPGLLEDGPSLVPGQTIGSYTIVREIGRGGMGRVYLAHDARLGRTVALKALPPDVSGQAHRERLRREARAAAALTHPGICTVYALEEFEGELYLATEFVDGHTLREEIESEERLAASDLLATARELAEALASAHAVGITHRDLKPENVMRNRRGRLKILDFGLARVDPSSADPGASIKSLPQVTQDGALVGTPAYMSPEQLNGRPADARSDVFACGVLLYELACGAHPFEAATPLAVAGRVLASEPPPLQSTRTDLNPLLVSVIERCLRKEPRDRFSSAAAMAAALATQPQTLVPGAALTADGIWWRTHQVATIGLYLLAVVLAWQVKELSKGTSPGTTQAVFLVIGMAAAVAGMFRGHLMFTERAHRNHLAGELRRAAQVTRVIDLAIAAALVLDGVLLARERPVVSVLTFALGAGVALARMLVEPSTTRAAFGDTVSPI